jgi:hypothetical protein
MCIRINIIRVIKSRNEMCGESDTYREQERCIQGFGGEI